MPMADKLSLLFDVECDRLDPHASASWYNTNLKHLRLKLEEVHDILHDAERWRSDQNPLPNSWISDLKNLAYDVDGLIDDWEQSENPKSKSKIDREVRRINGNLVQLLDAFQKFSLGLGVDYGIVSEVGFQNYGGFVSEKSDFIKTLLQSNDEENLRILSIKGKRGILNTLLAKSVFDDEKVKSHFEFRFWVSVGSNLDLLIIVKGIAVEYSKILSTENFLEFRLEDALKEKKLLIVLDDVRDTTEENLVLLKLWLFSNIGHPGSCVLVTTHSIKVANYLDTIPAPYLTGFPGDDSGAHLRNKFAQSLEESSSVFGREKGKYVAKTAPKRDSSFISGSFEIEEISVRNPSSNSESESAAGEFAGSSTEIVADDEMVLPMDESEIQPTYRKTGDLAELPLGTVGTISDGKERLLPIGDGRTEPELNASVKQSVESVFQLAAPYLGSSSVTVANTIHENVQKVFRYLNDVTATKIGVIGMGGIGKTTLLKALISNPKTKSMFDMVFFVTVLRCCSTRHIQNEVLRQFSLCCEDSETDTEVAERLFWLLNGKKFLLLLDDVFGHIDLGAVGIPDPSLENGCKIIVASRKLDVCHNMKTIEVETVSLNEAWEIFYEQVGGIIYMPHILPFARAIIMGCGGLPLLLIVTGRALIGEYNVSVWEHGSRKFSLPITIANHFVEHIIQLLKFSFDQLKDHDTKSCFLHFSLFPEDHEVPIFKFIEYCIQEGIITGSWAEAQKRGLDIVHILVGASLLQVNEAGDSIKMHDLIRDLALGILLSATEDSHSLLKAQGSQCLLRSYARLMEPSNPGSSSSSKPFESPESIRLFVPEAHQFLLRAGAGLTEPPSEEEWNQAKMIVLIDNDLCTLPEKPNCPKLDTLFLQRNCQLRVIPVSFFDFMTSLKLLNLSKTRIKSLPQTLFKLKTLQILILRECQRLATLPCEVGSLQSLEVLDLGGTEILMLPDEVGKLASLRHLEVSFYGSINRNEYVKLPLGLISSEIISRLHVLETLGIVVYPGDKRWSEDVKFVVVEVSNLTKLSSLSFHFPEVELLERFLQSSISWNAQCLTEFKFVVGRDVKSITSRVPNHLLFDYHQQSRCLRFVNGKKIPDAILRTLASSTALYLDHHLDIRSLTDFRISDINGLKFCIISECPKIEVVVDSKELTATVFPILENLSIHHLWNLMCIWEGIVPKGSLAELRILSVYACPRLKYVFSSSMTQFLCKLEQLVVEDCPAMEEIIHEGEIIDSDCIILPSLKKLTLHYLPGLVKIWTSSWSSLEHISFYDCPRLKNIGAGSKLKCTIKEIKAEKTWWDALEWEDDELHSQLQRFFTAISGDDL